MRENIVIIPDFENIGSVGPANHKINLVSPNIITTNCRYNISPLLAKQYRLRVCEKNKLGFTFLCSNARNAMFVM